MSMANPPKKFRFGSSAITDAIGDTVRRGSAEAGAFHVDTLDVEKIEPDPDNPRQLLLSEEEFAWLLDAEAVTGARVSDAESPRLKVLLRLRDLADSMLESGVLQPIRVFRHGNMYRIAYGERRYWAARLAGMKHLPAWISDQRPARIRTLQLVENMHRDDLDLAARMRNVMGVLEELSEEGDATGERLGNLLGMAERSARRYLQVARGPADVLRAVFAGTIKDLLVAASASAIQDDEQRSLVLTLLAKGLTLERALAELEKVRKPTAERMRGRPVTKVTLGATAKAGVVREIMQIILGEDHLPQLEWSDYRAVSKAWKEFLVEMEKRV
ncbi:ParB/RepB/Spo0J family partition protein [uncultured Thiodictyon sp.]|uniref:ParB/RepB/Spo0J family partition protein n=1 Tax=uncultured Thiodictyon sp. TaxID=1846217 RepID=UPI0025F672B8|nr:ParB/RepB/Spo0J family partition protein [uncultured Thiodictyon sp.]